MPGFEVARRYCSVAGSSEALGMLSPRGFASYQKHVTSGLPPYLPKELGRQCPCKARMGLLFVILGWKAEVLNQEGVTSWLSQPNSVASCKIVESALAPCAQVPIIRCPDCCDMVRQLWSWIFKTFPETFNARTFLTSLLIRSLFNRHLA